MLKKDAFILVWGGEGVRATGQRRVGGTSWEAEQLHTAGAAEKSALWRDVEASLAGACPLGERSPLLGKPQQPMAKG